MNTRHSPNVLLIDHDLAYSARVDEALKLEGFQTVQVNDVKTALEKLADHEFQVVVLSPQDKSNSIRNGLIALLPYLPKFKCILHSAKFNLPEVEELVDGGGFAWIQKKRDLSELVSLVGRAIGEHEPGPNPPTQETLTSTESLLTAIVDSTSDGIISATIDGTILSWNKGAERMFGYRSTQMVGTNVSIVFPPDRHGEFATAQGEILKGNSVEFESQRLRKNGSLLNVAVNLSPIKDDSGVSIGITAIIRDVTERVRNTRLRTDQLRFEQLISNLSADFINLPAHLIDQEMNRALQLIGQFIGVDRSIVLLLSSDGATLNCTHEWHNDIVDSAKERLQNISCVDSPWLIKKYLSGEIVVANDVSSLPPEAASETRTLGQFDIRSMLGIPLRIGGDVCGVACFDTVGRKKEWNDELISRMELVGQILANAIDRQQVDHALRESESRFRQLAASIDLVFWFVEVEPHRVLYASPAFENIWGISVEKLYANPYVWSEHIHVDDRDRVQRNFQGWMKGHKEQFHEQYRIVRPDGTIRWILDTGGFLPPTKNGAQRISGIAKDITQSKIAEANLRQREAELAHIARVSTMGELAGELAHELNQPLHAIGNFAAVARNALQTTGLNDDVANECLDNIQEQAKRSAEIIRRVKGYVRKTETTLESVELNQLVLGVAGLLSFDLHANSVDVQLALANDLRLVKADQLSIEQVLVNLIRNGIEAMSETPVDQRQIIISTKQLTNNMVETTVRDFGQGLSQQWDTSSAFEPFKTTKRSGIGLGLSICRSAIEAHGGRIWGKNATAGGAEFGFSLPAI